MDTPEPDTTLAAEPRPRWTAEEHAALVAGFRKLGPEGLILPIGMLLTVILFSQGRWLSNAPTLLLGELAGLPMLRYIRSRPLWHGTHARALMTPRETALYRWVMRQTRDGPIVLLHAPLLLATGALVVWWLAQGPQRRGSTFENVAVLLFGFAASTYVSLCAKYFQGLRVVRRHPPPPDEQDPATGV